jgi:predicted amidohydrolase
MWSNGFTQCPVDEADRPEWKRKSIDASSEYFSRFQEQANTLSVNIAMTYFEMDHEDNLYNSVAIVNKHGNVVLEYSKVNICDFGLDELSKKRPNRDDIGCDVFLSPGDNFPVCELETSSGLIQVGAMICADREMPEISTELFGNGAEIIVVPNACTWEPQRNLQLRSRAFEILGGVALANYPSPKCNGQSCAFDCIAWNKDGSYRDTQILKTNQEEGIFLAEFDIKAIREFRKEEQWRINNKMKFANRH